MDGTIFAGMESRIGAAVWNYDETQYFDSKQTRRMSRSSQLAVVAAGQAIVEAKLDQGKVDLPEVGVSVGSSARYLYPGGLPGGSLPSVQRRPRWNGAGRRGRDIDPRSGKPCLTPRCSHPGRDQGLRRLRRQQPPAQPTKDGPARAIRQALADASLGPENIDYINAHATGTEWNDQNETKAIKEVFGKRAYEIPVVGNKAALGHLIAGSGALELIGCILSLCDQAVPPTINYKQPECDLDYVSEGSRQINLQTIMSNSFAFGGSNAVLVAGKYESAH